MSTCVFLDKVTQRHYKSLVLYNFPYWKYSDDGIPYHRHKCSIFSYGPHVFVYSKLLRSLL